MIETLRWFPLVQRPRPPGRPLEARIRQLGSLATQAASDGDTGSRLVRAAEVCNLAALIASDCGLSDLARILCWRQYEIFENARPLPPSAGPLALQPLLNLPRQLIRDGDNDRASDLLRALNDAARVRTAVVIDGRIVDLRDLALASADHQAICTQIWAAFLADGTRALTQAGRWHEAADHAAAHRGVGHRLLDGRQAAILALAQDRQPDRATDLVEQSLIVERWEDVVQHLLRVHCRQAAGETAERELAAMLGSVAALLQEHDPSRALFRTRAALTALDLAAVLDAPGLPPLAAQLIPIVGSDAYAARDVLADPRLRQALTPRQYRQLAGLVDAAGFDTGSIAEPLYRDLMTAVSLAEDQLGMLLRGRGTATTVGSGTDKRRGDVVEAAGEPLEASRRDG